MLFTWTFAKGRLSLGRPRSSILGPLPRVVHCICPYAGAASCYHNQQKDVQSLQRWTPTFIQQLMLQQGARPALHATDAPHTNHLPPLSKRQTLPLLHSTPCVLCKPTRRIPSHQQILLACLLLTNAHKANPCIHHIYVHGRRCSPLIKERNSQLLSCPIPSISVAQARNMLGQEPLLGQHPNLEAATLATATPAWQPVCFDCSDCP